MRIEKGIPCDAHAGTSGNLCGNLPKMRAPLSRVRNSVTMLMLELARTSARTLPETMDDSRIISLGSCNVLSS